MNSLFLGLLTLFFAQGLFGHNHGGAREWPLSLLPAWQQRLSIRCVDDPVMRESDRRLVFVDLEVAGADISRPIIQVAAIAVASNLQELETFEAKLKFDRRLADPHSLTKNRYCPATWQAEARSATAVAR